jgi:fatty acid desaturase
MRPPAPQASSRARVLRRFGQLGYFALFFAGISLLGWWHSYLLYWLLPSFTFLPLFMRIRSIAEHFGLYERTDDLNSSRNYHGPRPELFIIAPHNIGYHLDHHLFLTIPFCNLPKAHALLETIDDYQKRAHENSSIFGTGKSVYRDLLGRS